MSDIILDKPNDNVKIMFVLTILLCLIKIIYLVRVFKDFNLLVTMLIIVVQDLFYFMILFMIFITAFAECYHILIVDISAYSRTPTLFAHFMATLRLSMGDFSYLDPY